MTSELGGFRKVCLVKVGRSRLRDHDRGTAEALARWIARLLDCPYAGPCDGSSHARRERAYIFPTDTMVGDEAARLGITGEESFFGGSTPFSFVCTKALTHGLVSAGATAPAGWRSDFASAVEEYVLPGFTAFDAQDAKAAAAILLPDGPVRLKCASSRGGLGQKVVANRIELDEALAQFGAEIANGIVIEQNLRDVRTYSVGQVRLGASILSYVGRQTLTIDGNGAEVYGGSDLRCVRGPFSALFEVALTPEERWSVQGAMAYDATAQRCYPGLVASRRNYDIACGMTPAGDHACGVLEQSWRWGGAAGAELAAFEFLMQHPSARSVATRTIERYGNHTTPEGAVLLYQGHDPETGRLAKYVVTDAT